MDTNSKYMQEKTLNRQQMQTILDQAPQGVDKKALIDKFVANGFTVEGVNDKKEPNIGQSILGGLLKAPAVLGQTTGAGAIAGYKTLTEGGDLGANYQEASKLYQKSGEQLGGALFGETVQPAQSAEQLAGNVLMTGAALAPGGVASKAGSTLGKIGLGALEGAGIGGAYFGGEAMSKDASLGEVAKQTAQGAGIGSVLGAALPIAEAVIPAGKALTQNLARKAQELKLNPEFAGQVVKSVVSQTSGISPEAITTIRNIAKKGEFESKFAPEVLANPRATEENILKSVTDDIEGLLTSKGEIGARYEEVLNKAPTIKFSRQALVNDIVDTTGLQYSIKDGFIKTADTVRVTPNEIAKLNDLIGAYKGINQLTGKQFVELRKAIGDLAYEGGIKTSTGKDIANKLYQSLNNKYRGQIPGLSELDNAFSGTLDDIATLKEYFKKNPATGGLEISDLANSKIANLLNRGKESKLATLEQYIPDLTDRIAYARALRAIDQAQGNVVGTYGKTATQLGSAALGGSVGGIPGALGAFIANAILMNPTNVVKMIGKTTTQIPRAVKSLPSKIKATPTMNKISSMTESIPQSTKGASGKVTDINIYKKAFLDSASADAFPDIAQKVKDAKTVEEVISAVSEGGNTSMSAYVSKLNDTIKNMDKSTTGKMSGFAQITGDDALYNKAIRSSSPEKFITSLLDEYTITLPSTKKVYRGEGKGIGNTTLVKGKYFADSKKFAENFGEVTVDTIPKGAKVLDLDFIKNENQNIFPIEWTTNPDKFTQFLLDNGYEYTKNTNSRGVEYVKLNRINRVTQPLLRRAEDYSNWQNEIKKGEYDVMDLPLAKYWAEVNGNTKPGFADLGFLPKAAIGTAVGTGALKAGVEYKKSKNK